MVPVRYLQLKIVLAIWLVLSNDKKGLLTEPLELIKKLTFNLINLLRRYEYSGQKQ